MSLAKNAVNVIAILYTKTVIDYSHKYDKYVSMQEEDEWLKESVMFECSNHRGGVFSSFLDRCEMMSLDEMREAPELREIVSCARRSIMYDALFEARKEAGIRFNVDPSAFVGVLTVKVAVELHNNVISPTFFQLCELRESGFKIECYDESVFSKENREVMRRQLFL